jgi:GTP-binding protein
MYGDEARARQGRPDHDLQGPRARTGDRLAEAGDIVLVTGIEQVGIGVTLCDPDARGMPPLAVDEPTPDHELPWSTPRRWPAGRQVRHQPPDPRAPRKGTAEANVALRVEFSDDADVFLVSGRGELHLTILLENMRREGYELAVSAARAWCSRKSTA